jgi:hypothetical protein
MIEKHTAVALAKRNAMEQELLSQSDSAGFVGILRLRRTIRFANRPAALRMTVRIVLRKKAA